MKEEKEERSDLQWNSLVFSLDGEKGKEEGTTINSYLPFIPSFLSTTWRHHLPLPFSREWNPLFMDREKREYPVEERERQCQLVAHDEISPFYLPFVQSAQGMGRRSEEEDDSTFFRD